jgi:hypothetical protein
MRGRVHWGEKCGSFRADPESRAFSRSKKEAATYKNGDLVLVLATKKTAIVRWIGVVDITADERTFLGVEYDEPCISLPFCVTRA